VVLTPVGSGGPGCDSYNINADTVACAVAEELNAEKLIILSDVPGLLRDVEDPQSVISQVTTSELAGLIADGTIGGGMIPKAEAGISAIANGVHSVHMVDGRAEHSLLVELFTEEGIGTMITAGSESGAGGAGND
jgi:acetylglutamate kinase